MERGIKTGTLIYITGVSCIAGFMFGYDSSVISGASLYLYADLGYASNTVKQVVVSVILIGTVVDSLV